MQDLPSLQSVKYFTWWHFLLSYGYILVCNIFFIRHGQLALYTPCKYFTQIVYFFKTYISSIAIEYRNVFCFLDLGKDIFWLADGLFMQFPKMCMRSRQINGNLEEYFLGINIWAYKVWLTTVLYMLLNAFSAFFLLFTKMQGEKYLQHQ